jgi:hypothetical protein
MKPKKDEKKRRHIKEHKGHKTKRGHGSGTTIITFSIENDGSEQICNKPFPPSINNFSRKETYQQFFLGQSQ